MYIKVNLYKSDLKEVMRMRILQCYSFGFRQGYMDENIT